MFPKLIQQNAKQRTNVCSETGHLSLAPVRDCGHLLYFGQTSVRQENHCAYIENLRRDEHYPENHYCLPSSLVENPDPQGETNCLGSLRRY